MVYAQYKGWTSNADRAYRSYPSPQTLGDRGVRMLAHVLPEPNQSPGMYVECSCGTEASRV